MSDTELVKQMNEARPLILWAELGGLLHDIGKLSNEFYEYRRNWRQWENGWNRDPHDHEFFGKNIKNLNNHEFSKLKEICEKSVWELCKDTDVKKLFPDAEKCSIATFIDKHTDPGDTLTRMLKAADSKDAAIERNNPLFSADQTQGTIYDADVFGHEIEWSYLTDNERNELYKILNQLVREGLNLKDYKYEQRQAILETIKRKFQNAFSDTTRPDNDISLWEHSYAVATILKVLVAHKIIYGESLDDFKKVRFGILGIGWDRLAFMSQGDKIGDVVQAQNILEDLKKHITTQIEYEYTVGNMIYEDNDGIYFMIPAISELDSDTPCSNSYRNLLDNLKTEIEEFAVNITCGDLIPEFYMVENTRFITHIARCITRLKEKTGFLVPHLSDNTLAKLTEPWENKKPIDICPVCMRRPVEEDKAGKRDICKICKTRREKTYRLSGKKTIEDIEQTEKDQGTAFISEIVRANNDRPEAKNDKPKELKRAALVVARFHLDKWLDGTMLRSLFITEARGLEKELADLGNTRCFRSEEMEARQHLENSPYGNLVNKGYDYEHIKHEVFNCYDYGTISDDRDKEYARNTTFLYDRRIVYDHGKKENILQRQPENVHCSWSDWLRNTQQEYDLEKEEPQLLLPNILCAKTPTPSTILDVWETTGKFFSVFGESISAGLPKKFVRIRVSFDKESIDNLNKINEGTAHSGYIVGEDEKILKKEKGRIRASP